MTPLAQTPFLSLVVPTRNRPQLFRRAILSILNQTFTNIEIIAVVDGATNDDLLEYKKLEKEFKTYLTFIFLPHRDNGHGPSFARNTGINSSKGLYIGFLDDDDEWTSNEHLATFYKSYEESNAKLDIYFSNQRALKTNGDQVNGPVWIEDVIKKTTSLKQIIDNVFIVALTTLLTSDGFSHLNCTIIKRELLSKIEGFNESLRYEEDKDFYLRAIDKATHILFHSEFIGTHYVPDSKSASTVLENTRKLEYQICSMTNLVSKLEHLALRKKCQMHLSTFYKQLTGIKKASGDYDSTFLFSRLALAAKFSLKWFLYCCFLRFKYGWKN